MPSEPTQETEVPPSEPQLKKAPTAGKIASLVVVIFLAAAVTFFAVFAIGSIVGTRISATGGPINEHHMGRGVAIGLIAGILCSLGVAVLFSRRLFSG